jgi:hypothetical protein
MHGLSDTTPVIRYADHLSNINMIKFAFTSLGISDETM